MIGERLAEARKRAGLAQAELAAALGERYSGSMVSMVEHNRTGMLMDGAVNAARELGVSLDYLFGLTDDPTPSAKLSGLTSAGGEVKEADDLGGDHWRDVPIREVRPAAGVGAEVFGEEIVGYVPFRRDWIDEHSIDPAQADVVAVRGESMHPTLPDGCLILVDRKCREPLESRLYVMRTEEGLVVKRLGLDEAGNWEARSDNGDWQPQPLRYGTEIIGTVRWMARPF